MANAGGIAFIFGGLSSQTYQFNAGLGIGFDNVSGTWTDDGNTITWAGDDPSMTKGSTGQTTVTSVDVGVGSTQSQRLICSIEHSGVELSEGDTIIYTSVQISFTT